MKNKLNVAVIGAGIMAQLHMKGVMAYPNAELYAICDIAQERIDAIEKGITAQKYCNDYMELVNDKELDAVVLVVPDQLHCEMTKAFLKAGKAVLCEKPMALFMEECEEMLRCERETNGKLMIGQICRSTPAFKMAKQIIDDGRIGELFFVESEYAHNYDNARGYKDWRVVPERNGFIGGGCHAVDLLRWIAGNPTEVSAISNHKCMLDWPTNDMTVALYKFPNDVAGKVFCSTGCRRSYTMRSVFYGTKGTIICDNTSSTMQLFSKDEPFEDGKPDYQKPHIIDIPTESHNATDEIRSFLDAVINEKPMPVSSIDGASTVAVACATLKAAESGKVEKIEYPKA